jgi:hypothetical protein
MAGRLARRSYNEYCRPAKNFQPAWDTETERIERACIIKVDVQRARERQAKSMVVLARLFAISAVCVALTAGGLNDTIMCGVLAVACLLAVAYVLRVQKRHVEVDNWVRSRLVA